MSTRSLQAKLQEEGTSYNRIAGELRKELAVRYLDREEHRTYAAARAWQKQELMKSADGNDPEAVPSFPYRE